MKQTQWLSALFIGAMLSACAPAPSPVPSPPPSPPAPRPGEVKPAPGGEMMMCTQEAKLCRDGKTAVGRNSAKGCAFDPCPGDK